MKKLGRYWAGFTGLCLRDWKSLLPFGLIYIFIHASLTIAETSSLSLTVNSAGAEVLPQFYALAAAITFFLMLFYIRYSSFLSPKTIFVGILVISGLVFFALYWFAVQFRYSIPYGFFVMGKEVITAITLTHFTVFFQNSFQRKQISRIVATTFAFGRLGGVLGGFIVEKMTPVIGPVQLLLWLPIGFGMASILVLVLLPEKPIRSKRKQRISKDILKSDGPLLKWHMASSTFYFASMLFLNYQYNLFFQKHFSSASEMNIFLAQYTQISLVVSFIFQTLMTSRLVKRIGLHRAFGLYNLTVLLAFAGLFIFPSLWTASFSRFVEIEWRTCLRNPVNQMIIALYDNAIRPFYKGLETGLIKPVGVLLSYVVVAAGVSTSVSIFPVVGVVSSIGYFITSLKLEKRIVWAQQR